MAMAYVTGGVGVVLGLFIMAVSAVVNARYGMIMIKDNFDKSVMVAVGVFADITKAMCWFYFRTALARREFISSLLSFVLFVACLGWAVSGALGYISLNRTQSSDSVVREVDIERDEQAELKRKVSALQALGNVEPAGVIRKRLEAMKTDKRYSLTEKCRATVYDSHRAFCASWSKLEAEHEKALSYAKLEREVEELRKKRNAKSAVVSDTTKNEGDLQSAVISQLSNLKISTVQTGLNLLFVIVLECGACYMLWLANNHFLGEMTRAPVVVNSVDDGGRLAPNDHDLAQVRLAQPIRTQAEAQDFVAYINEHLDLAPGQEIATDTLVTSFKDWCVKRCLRPLSDDMIERGLAQLAQAGSVKALERNGQKILVGVVLQGKAPM